MFLKPSILDRLPGTVSRILRVLLLENNPDHAELIQNVLVTRGECFRMEVCEDRSDFMVRVTKNSFDALLIDYHGPQVDHLALFEEIRSLKISVPVIFISGSDNEETITQILRAGAADFVIKTRTSLKTLPVVVKRSIIRNLKSAAHPDPGLEKSFREISKISHVLARKITKRTWSHRDFDRLKILETLLSKAKEAVKPKKPSPQFIDRSRRRKTPEQNI